MDPLRLNAIAQDGDFRKVRQLVKEDMQWSSPEPTIQEKQKLRKRNHPWKSPVERYRQKQLLKPTIDEDEHLEELSWKHRSRCYDLRPSDLTFNRVYHWNLNEMLQRETNKNNDPDGHQSNGYYGLQPNATSFSTGSYTDRRPKSIDTKPSVTQKMLQDDQQVTTPATVDMDDDEFDSPSYGSTPLSLASLDSSPSVVTPPKAILDQLALYHNPSGETEISLKMFEAANALAARRGLESIKEERVLEEVQGAVKEILEQRCDVRKLIEEHERLLAETHRTTGVSPKSVAKSQPRTFSKSTFYEKETISSPSETGEESLPRRQAELFLKKEHDSGETALEERHATQTNGRHPIILDEEDEDEAFLPRSSILTTIAEESTPSKSRSPRFVTPKRLSNDSKGFGTKINSPETHIRTSNLFSPEGLESGALMVLSKKDFIDKRITKLNKVTIAAALIEFNTAFKEQNKPGVKRGKITDDTKLKEVIKRHRQKHGFWTGTTPTKETMKIHAAIIIQASWRTVLAIRRARRKLYVALDFAATLIQAQWRSYDNRMNFKWHRGSAAILQAKWRSHACHKQYESLRSATFVVQSITRMSRCRGKFLQCKGSAIVVQAKWRSRSCQKRYESLRASTISIQSIARMHLCRQEYRSMLSSAILLQSAARMHIFQARFLEWLGSAQIAQTYWRSYICQKQYNALRSSAILVQSVARMHLHRARFLKFRACATAIQAASRTFLCRNRYRECKNVVTTLQAVSRMLACRSKYLACKKAAVTLQSMSRAHSCRNEFAKTKKAAVIVQAAQRMNLCRTRYLECKMAATLLQSVFRMHLLRTRYSEQKFASTTLQAALRMHARRSEYLQNKRAVTTLQAILRMYIARIAYLKQQRAATTLQGVLRTHRIRSEYLAQKSAALVIQAAVREHIRQKDYAMFEALREVQAKWRSSVCKNDYQTLMEIQQIPTTKKSSIIKHNFMCYLSSSIIQRRWRNYTHRKSFWAASCIQTAWRAFVCQKEFDKAVFSARILQASWRAFHCRKHFVSQRASTSLLQQKWRSYNCRKNYIAMLASAKVLQSSYRAHVCKRDYEIALQSTAKLQSFWRSYKCRNTYLLRVWAATKLQSTFRAYACRIKYAVAVANRAAKLARQEASRKAVARLRRERTERLTRQKAILTIQSCFRGHACRKAFTVNLNAAIERKLREASEILLNDEDDEGPFLGRSSTLTTIREELSPLNVASPPLESPNKVNHYSPLEPQHSDNVVQRQNEFNGLQYHDLKKTNHVDEISQVQAEKVIDEIVYDAREAENEIISEELLEVEFKSLEYPASNEPEVVHDENLQEGNHVKYPVQVEARSETSVSYDRSSISEDRRSSEERLLALAAKVAKRRASLNRRKKLDLGTRDPWQRRKESQKKSKTVLLSKRMVELERLAGQKRVSGSRWNEEQNEPGADTVDNEPLVRYPNVFGDNRAVEEKDPVVKKLFEFDGHNNIVSNETGMSGNHSGIHMIEHQEFYDTGDDGISDITDMYGNEGANDSSSHARVRADLPDDLVVENRTFENNVDENEIVFNDVYAIDDENDGECERRDAIRSWNRRSSIVDDLADNVCDFEPDSDNEEDDISIPDMDEFQFGGEVHDESKENDEGTHSTWKEWSVVDDLTEDVEDIPDMGDGYDSDEDGKKDTSVYSRLSLDAFFVSFYTIAGLAASLIGVSE
jgi:hypothetical protein